MRLPDDDEIYDVDQTYLGPPGKYMGRLRYRAVGIYPVVLIVGFATLSYTGLGPGLNGVQLVCTGGVVIGGKRLTDWILEHVNVERPLGVFFTSFSHEVTAPRASKRRDTSRRPTVLSSRRVRLETGDRANKTKDGK